MHLPPRCDVCQHVIVGTPWTEQATVIHRAFPPLIVCLSLCDACRQRAMQGRTPHIDNETTYTIPAD